MDALLLREPEVVNRGHDVADALLSFSTLTDAAKTDLSGQVALLREHADALDTDLSTAFREAPRFSGSQTLESALVRPSTVRMQRPMPLPIKLPRSWPAPRASTAPRSPRA